ncbi:MAG: hypothetical protein ACD_71C00179G0003 [uncultured bacterium (gcode 4)]|uniref:Uncharacterized protein n=1 Tax=uncultured bacterium (gcode 4) TaxID=1234023 RepID=K1ZIP7_9BACT|nr:MAG: hypothetical protein ACD_71C00179G0003 [uncultured bacterium (gcode 4)]
MGRRCPSFLKWVYFLAFLNLQIFQLPYELYSKDSLESQFLLIFWEELFIFLFSYFYFSVFFF